MKKDYGFQLLIISTKSSIFDVLLDRWFSVLSSKERFKQANSIVMKRNNFLDSDLMNNNLNSSKSKCRYNHKLDWKTLCRKHSNIYDWPSRRHFFASYFFTNSEAWTSIHFFERCWWLKNPTIWLDQAWFWRVLNWEEKTSVSFEINLFFKLLLHWPSAPNQPKAALASLGKFGCSWEHQAISNHYG